MDTVDKSVTDRDREDGMLSLLQLLLLLNTVYSETARFQSLIIGPAVYFFSDSHFAFSEAV